jgi:hypothetical protein
VKAANAQAGEDLAEIPEEEDVSIEHVQDEPAILPTGPMLPVSATLQSALSQEQPLLGHRRLSKSMPRRLSVTQRGDATVKQAVFIVGLHALLSSKTFISSQLFKSFIGTGVLFLGKAYVSYFIPIHTV